LPPPPLDSYAPVGNLLYPIMLNFASCDANIFILHCFVTVNLTKDPLVIESLEVDPTIQGLLATILVKCGLK
jgi:hypothetical protein